MSPLKRIFEYQILYSNIQIFEYSPNIRLSPSLIYLFILVSTLDLSLAIVDKFMVFNISHVSNKLTHKI